MVLQCGRQVHPRLHAVHGCQQGLDEALALCNEVPRGPGRTTEPRLCQGKDDVHVVHQGSV